MFLLFHEILFSGYLVMALYVQMDDGWTSRRMDGQISLCLRQEIPATSSYLELWYMLCISSEIPHQGHSEEAMSFSTRFKILYFTMGNSTHL